MRRPASWRPRLRPARPACSRPRIEPQSRLRLRDAQCAEGTSQGECGGLALSVACLLCDLG